MPDLVKRFWAEFVAEPLRRQEKIRQAYLATVPPGRPDWKLMIVLVVAAVALALQEYLSHGGAPAWALELLEEPGQSLGLVEGSVHADRQAVKVFGLARWALGCLVFFFALPALVVRCVFREPLRSYGLTWGEGHRHWYFYALMLVVMAPLIWLVSYQSAFQRTYPFYSPASGEALWPRFWCWELMYWMQFFALEFFFRGFMVHGLKHRFGAYGIFVMMVPYCMIHFSKPMPETFAAIIAGIVLGFMSLTTGSIWLGVAVHISVAVSMDLTSLLRRGHFS
jgi:membrane protease YdiL (CAAX protease family)